MCNYFSWVLIYGGVDTEKKDNNIGISYVVTGSNP